MGGGEGLHLHFHIHEFFIVAVPEPVSAYENPVLGYKKRILSSDSSLEAVELADQTTKGNYMWLIIIVQMFAFY